MTDQMQADALEIGKNAIMRFKTETEIADYIKTEFDKLHGDDWHCIVG